jgi:hypothetical protein
MHTLKSFCDQVQRMRMAHSRIDDLLHQLGTTPKRKADQKDILIKNLKDVCYMAKQLESQVDEAIVEINIDLYRPPIPPEIPAERRLGSHVWQGPSEQL